MLTKRMNRHSRCQRVGWLELPPASLILHVTSRALAIIAKPAILFSLSSMPRCSLRLTDYVYELSERFNAFYVDCKVLGTEEEGSRLQLVEATARVMRQCFSLLGLTPLYRI